MDKYMMNIVHYLIHTAAYYFAWFIGIFFAAQGRPWLSSFVILTCVSLQLYWQFLTKQSLARLGYLVLIIVTLSTFIDSLMIYHGIVVYSANPFAPYFTSPWMISLWISFSVVLFTTLSILFDHLATLGVLSLIGFFFAFRIGATLGAASFPYGINMTCLFIGFVWSLLLPICVYFVRHKEE
jgi:hypothetical protein